MRVAFLVLVFGAAASAAPVPNEIEEFTWPILQQYGVTLEVITSTFATRYDATAGSYVNIAHEDVVPYAFSLVGMAHATVVGERAETVIDATLNSPDVFFLTLAFDGPANVSLTGPGVDDHWNYPETFGFPFYMKWYGAGDYQLTMTQTLPSEHGNRSIVSASIIIPEPSTWMLALTSVVWFTRFLRRGSPASRPC